MRPPSHPWRIAARDTQAWFVIGIITGGIAFSIWLSFADPTGGTTLPTPLLGVAGCFFLAYAVPYAAIRIAESERDGRFDQLRLTGQPPWSLLLVAGGGAALPWAIGGLAYLAAGAWLGGLPRHWPQIVPLVTGAGLTASVLALSLRRSPHVTDFRIVMVAAALYVGTFSTIAINSDAPLQDLLDRYLLSHPWRVASLMAVQALIMAACLPRMLAGIARPQQPRLPVLAAARPSRFSLPVPAFFRRGVSIGLIAALALTGFVLTIIAAVTIAGRRPSADAAIAIGFLPWIIGAVVISTTSRADAETPRLDVLRLSHWSATATAIRMTVDLWAPFLGSIAIITLAFASVGRTSPDLVTVTYALLIVVVVAPMALIEGWHRALMLTYVLPTMVGAIALISFRSGRWEMFLTFLAVAWIPWAIAAAAIRRGIGVPLDRRVAVLAVVAVLLAGDWGATIRQLVSPATSVAMLMMAAWLDDGRRSWRTVWPLLAIVLAVGLALRASIDDRVSAALAAVLPAAALLAGLRIHQALGALEQPWSIAIRTGLVMTLLTLNTAIFRVLIMPRMNARSMTPEVVIAMIRIEMLAALVVIAGATLLVEAYARFFRARATPRA